MLEVVQCCIAQVGKPRVPVSKITRGLLLLAAAAPHALSYSVFEMVFKDEDGMSAVCRAIISNDNEVLGVLLPPSLPAPPGLKAARIRSGRWDPAYASIPGLLSSLPQLLLDPIALTALPTLSTSHSDLPATLELIEALQPLLQMLGWHRSAVNGRLAWLMAGRVQVPGPQPRHAGSSSGALHDAEHAAGPPSLQPGGEGPRHVHSAAPAHGPGRAASPHRARGRPRFAGGAPQAQREAAVPASQCLLAISEPLTLWALHC